MKKILITVLALFSLALVSSAQTTEKKKVETPGHESKTKSERTTTVPQKVHNIIHPRHKKYSGHKSKYKSSTK